MEAGEGSRGALLARLPGRAKKPDETALSISAWQVIQAIPEGVILTDPRAVILAVNDAFCAVTGYERAEVLGRSPGLLSSGRHGRAFYSRMWAELRRTGRWQGEIWNRRKNGAVYPEWLSIGAIRDAWGHLRCYLGVFRDLTTPKLDEERLRRLAQSDPLTGLPNRRFFMDRLRRALARRAGARRAAVLFLDLDRFKEVNDRWGHAAGDALLTAVARRLRGSLRRSDTAARWAGDEFAVLLERLSSFRAARRAALKIARVLRRPFFVRGRRFAGSASVGACMAGGAPSAERLLSRADRAMYEAKRAGRDRVGFWTPRKASGRIVANSKTVRRKPT